jgi:hypothetical protein
MPIMEADMSRLSLAIGVFIAGFVFVVACNSRTGSPTAPSSGPSMPAATQAVASSATTLTPTSATHAEELTAVLGSGSGIVNVTPTAAAVGFSAQITVSIHGAAPNTTFYVQRAPELDRANSADGICQRAAGLPPWGPPTPNFITVPFPFPGPLLTLRTSEEGAGAVHTDFAVPAIADGTRFDVMFRLVDNLTSPTNELRTGCFTVSVK